MIAGTIESNAALEDLATQTGSTVEALTGLAAVGKFSDQSAQSIADAMGKLTDPMFGNIQPDETVELYYNFSTDDSGKDERGPWNSEPDFKYIADPASSLK